MLTFIYKGSIDDNLPENTFAALENNIIFNGFMDKYILEYMGIPLA